MTITDYAAMEAYKMSDIVEMVNKAIGQGWQPYGDLVLDDRTNGSAARYIQPMVKYLESKEQTDDKA